MILKNKKGNNSYYLGIFIIIVIICLNALGQYFKFQQLITLGLIPLLSVIAFTKDVKEFALHKTEFNLFLFLFLISFTTAFNYVDYDSYMRSMYIFLGAILSAYIVVGLNKTNNYISFFHIGYILSIILLFAIMYINGNISLVNFASVVDYRDRFMLNANAYSYYSVFANFSLFYLYLKNKNKLLSVLLIFLPILFLIISFTTQSRSGLYLIITINVIFWVFINKSENKSKLKKLFKTITFFLIFTIASIKFIDIYQNSRIKNRISTYSDKVDPRETLISEGIHIFSENSILGVGLGQFPFYNSHGQFSHNSYIEIFAEQGFFGGIVLLLLFGIPLYKSIMNLRFDIKNEILRCNLFFFIIFLVFNNVYVFYKFPFSMMYFFLIVMTQNKLNDKDFKTLN